MVPDLYALVRRDHDDLDQGLAAMLETRTPVEDLPVLLDLFKLALAVHVAAEGKVLGSMVVRSMAPASLRALAAEAHREHVEQQRATDALASQPPGSDAWYASVLELRVLVVDHASRAELSRWAWLELLPGPVCRALASGYATERMRVLARTSPVALARAELAAGAR
jgi:hypothetical protein